MAGWRSSAILLLFLAATTAVAAPLKLVDDAGRAVVLNLHAARIVALSPHVTELKRRYAGRQPVRVFYEIWHEPLITVNGEHLISDVLGLCGGRNIFAGVSSLTPAVAVESVLAEDPEAIIASGALYAERGPLEGWRRYPRLAAVRRGHVFFIHPNLIQRQTPRILQGAQQMCEQIEQVRKTEIRKN